MEGEKEGQRQGKETETQLQTRCSSYHGNTSNVGGAVVSKRYTTTYYATQYV